MGFRAGTHMSQALQWCAPAGIRAAPVAPSVPVTGMLREQIRGKIMPMFSWATRCWYPCSPLQPLNAWTALFLVWDQQLRPHRQESGWKIPSLPLEQGPRRQFPSSRVAGAVSQLPRGRGEGLGLPAGFPLQVAVQPGGVHPLCLLRRLVWAVQPHQPDGAQHCLLPEGLLPSIW